ncbi:hypothetical protein CSKR_104910 [Clonorchis sinensis]|uniref:Uncharacterized protein n=1 Tax=Clonorchis sinensis TaxID=79923 RepID=A0A419Q745_CLOSI|nr:hypothetical protein CSKR_104910 [Clonorchis sinensis]
MSSVFRLNMLSYLVYYTKCNLDRILQHIQLERAIINERYKRKFTDRKVRGSNPNSASRLPLPSLGQTANIPAVVSSSGDMATRHRKGVTVERLFIIIHYSVLPSQYDSKWNLLVDNCCVEQLNVLNQAALCFSWYDTRDIAIYCRVEYKHMYICNALLIRLLKVLRQPTTGFALLGTQQETSQTEDSVGFQLSLSQDQIDLQISVFIEVSPSWVQAEHKVDGNSGTAPT